jgi:hypothetical protein
MVKTYFWSKRYLFTVFSTVLSCNACLSYLSKLLNVKFKVKVIKPVSILGPSVL